ncbi:LOW QUALITY PROTEIN: hypothetical protein MC885_014299 [Smutsia gigantea]|nr:LOW QUALITY PROTEIN: hypothetical protein MC885_014299 [Smutsia gigantea]
MLCKVVKVVTAKEMTLESSERIVSDLTASLQERESHQGYQCGDLEALLPGLKLQELQHLKNYQDHSETRG